ncbi:MAG: hypothetical protein SGJ20_15670 [Planctomycetota bacterium]|nr:hypothetical protein [Planctomycetota bacterium]
MSRLVYYTQECPTCGRSLRVRVSYLGRQVICQHCDAQFKAVDPSAALHDPDDVGSSLLQRADLLLETVDRQRNSSIG